MAKRIIIDPITRIEGHLRIEVELDEKNVIRDAWSSITLWRGIETILKGRDPRDAGLIVQRFCGVCTMVHYEASILACEDAFGVKPPPNARIIRNLMAGAWYLGDHIMHFYHLHGMDWIDVVSALSANPAKAVELAKSYHPNPYNCSETHYKAVQERLTKFVKSGRLGPFANAYWGNPSYKLPPEANLIILSHYLDALSVSKICGQMQAIFGGKNPHPQSLVVGGVTSVMDSLDPQRLGAFLFRLKDARNFVETAYIPDVLLAATYYKGEGLAGVGGGVQNYLCYGGFPLDDDWSTTLFPRGVVKGRNLAKPLQLDESKITEEVTHSWYKGTKPEHPYEGTTEPEYTGYDGNGYLKGNEKYSWCKAPRFDGEPYEVGPLARMVVGYALGDKRIKPLVEGTLKKTGLPAEALFSTLGRTAARAIETKLVGDQIEGWVNELVANIKKGDTRTWTRCDVPSKAAQGRGMTEPPRGALGHWIRIENKVIANYQAVVPSTWNCSPRDKAGKRGPYEESLIGTKLAKADQPLEILRTIHSFDPCMACAVHIVDPKTNDVRKYRVA
ncbi:MAG TPA: nickel-dependent hydrogenase large subunit [Syntrophales bacterium]|nr:nickel-dependent hydrogenase large subunit [Syntrophales bacterium]